jgi:hypothetical protein
VFADGSAAPAPRRTPKNLNPHLRSFVEIGVFPTVFFVFHFAARMAIIPGASVSRHVLKGPFLKHGAGCLVTTGGSDKIAERRSDLTMDFCSFFGRRSRRRDH